MTTYYLINNIRGVHAMYAGSLVDSKQRDISQIQASGGVLIPTCPQLDGAAMVAQNLVRDGNSQFAESVMSAAVDALQIEVYVTNTVAKLISLGKPNASAPAAIHAAYDADMDDDEFPGPITSPDVPRSVTVTFSLGWDGGDVIIHGYLNGSAKMIIIDEDEDVTVETDLAFDTITSIEKTKKGTAGSASVGLGSRLLVHEGGVPLALANATSVLWVDGASEVPVVSTTHSTVTPGAQKVPDGNRSYQVLVNVNPSMTS